jgi:CBF1 interacting corepressor
LYSWSNQKQVWEARQKDDIEKRRLAEREAQLRREREEEDLARVVGGEEARGRKALSFMYEAGKVPGLDRKADTATTNNNSGADATVAVGGQRHTTDVDGNGNCNNEMSSLFERQPGDDDAAAAFREMLARGSMVGNQPYYNVESTNANINNEELDANTDNMGDATNEARDRDLRTNLEKAVGRGITSGSGVTLAQQMERFPMLKGAPRVLPKSSGGGGEDGKEASESDVVGLNFKPLGQVLRNVKCMKCGQWGHSMGDRECGVSGWNPFAAVSTSATTMAPPSNPSPVAVLTVAAPAASATASIVVASTRNEDLLGMKRDEEREIQKPSSSELKHKKRSSRKHKRSRRAADKDGRSHHKRRKSGGRRHDRSPSSSSFSDSSTSTQSSYSRRGRHHQRHHHRRHKYSDDESSHSSIDRRHHGSRKESSNRRRETHHSSSRRKNHRDRRDRSRSRSRSPSLSE